MVTVGGAAGLGARLRGAGGGGARAAGGGAEIFELIADANFCFISAAAFASCSARESLRGGGDGARVMMTLSPRLPPPDSIWSGVAGAFRAPHTRACAPGENAAVSCTSAPARTSSTERVRRIVVAREIFEGTGRKSSSVQSNAADL